MALEDLISKPIPDALSGLSAGLQTGVDLASKLYDIRKQQDLVQLEKDKIKLQFQEKAVDLIPKIKGLGKQERGFFINALAGFSKNAGYELPEDFVKYLSTSEETTSSMEALVKAAYQKYPSQNQSVQRSGFVLDAIRQAGMSITDSKPILDAMTADTLALVKRDQIDAAENAKRASRIANIALKSNPSQEFRQQVASLPAEDQEAAYGSYAGVKSKLDSISKNVFLDPNKTKNMPQSDLEATKKLWGYAQALSQNPNSLPLAEKMISDLEQSLVGLGVQAGQVVQTKAAQVEKQKLSKEQSDQVGKLVKEVQTTAKPEIETINTASKVINILNNPKVSGTPLAWGAVGTLLSRYYDPRTGVKESELDRVLRSVQGSTVEQWKQSFFAFFQGKSLTPDQKNLIGELVNTELADVEKNVGSIREVINQRSALTGINPDLVFKSVFYKGIPKYTPISGATLLGENPFKEKGFFEKIKARLFGAEAPAAATPTAPKPQASPQAHAAPAEAKKPPAQGMGKQGLRKLFPGVIEQPKQGQKPQAKPSQNTIPTPKKGKWVPMTLPNGLQIEEFVEE